MPLINMLSLDKRPNGTRQQKKSREKHTAKTATGKEKWGNSGNTHDAKVSGVQNMTINQQPVAAEGNTEVERKTRMFSSWE